MRKILIVLPAILMLASCSEYQKVLKNKDTGKKYTMAEQLYTQAQQDSSKSDYKKALRLLDQIIPQYRGKPQGEKLTYLYADTYFQLEDYYLSGYQFERFTEAYPKSERLEEAAFKSAKSYYYLSPRYDLDQSQTVKAMAALQKYIDVYPKGENIAEANKLNTDLQVKLEKKAFEIAKQYHLTEDYKSAIVAFNNFIADYPGSPFREAAFYYRYDSAYQLAINSYRYLMKDRLNEAKDYYDNYIGSYPEGSVYYNQLQTSFEDLDSRLQNF